MPHNKEPAAKGRTEPVSIKVTVSEGVEVGAGKEIPVLDR